MSVAHSRVLEVGCHLADAIQNIFTATVNSVIFIRELVVLCSSQM